MATPEELFLKTFAPQALGLQPRQPDLQDTLLRGMERQPSANELVLRHAQNADLPIYDALSPIAALAAPAALPGPGWLRILSVLDSVSPKADIMMGTIPSAKGPKGEAPGGGSAAGRRLFQPAERDALLGELYDEVGKSARNFAKRFGYDASTAEDFGGNSIIKLMTELEKGVPAGLTDPKDLRSYLMKVVQNDLQDQATKLSKDPLRIGQSLDEMLGDAAEGASAPLQVAEGGQVSRGLSDVGRILKEEGVEAAPVAAEVSPLVETIERLKGVKAKDTALAKRLYERGLSRQGARATGLRFDDARVSQLRKDIGEGVATDAAIFKELGVGEPQIRKAVNDFIDAEIAANPRTNLRNLRNTATSYLVDGPPKLSPRQLSGRAGSSAESLFRRLKIISNGVKAKLLPIPD